MPFQTEINAHIAELIFNKPPVNAFDSREWAAIAAELERLGALDEVRVIVIRAEGKGFCAGVDIKELAADSSKIIAVNKGNYDTFAAIHRNRVPVIVALHGFVLGGGIGIGFFLRPVHAACGKGERGNGDKKQVTHEDLS